VYSLQVWGCDIIVDWADPQEEPDEQTMSKVKVLYVRNLTQDVTEEKLKVIAQVELTANANNTYVHIYTILTGTIRAIWQSGTR